MSSVLVRRYTVEESIEAALTGSNAVSSSLQGITWDSLFQAVPLNVVFTFMLRAVICIIIWIIGKKIIKKINRIVEKTLEASKAKWEVFSVTKNLIWIGGYIIIFVIMAHILEIPVAPVITVLGSAGLGIVLALKDYLGNLAGGVILIFLTPFQVGDYIIDGDKNEGTVNAIGLFYTTLLTLDGKTIVIPNSILTKNCLVNITREGRRRVEIKVGISYQSDLKKAKAIMEQLIVQDKACLADPPYQVVIGDLSESAVIIQGLFWVKQEDYWNSLCNIKENVKLAYDENDINIPYNQLDVHVIQR